MPSEPTKASNAGIITDDAGERQIPESKRADGSTRKAIKIRPGYRPPEDVEVYKNRTAAAFRDRTAGGGIPGAAASQRRRPKAEEVDPEVEKEKKARNLKKKLKQAKDLKSKKEGGETLLPEQIAKVIKINELIRELDALGFDAEGEPKAAKDAAEGDATHKDESNEA
ncbi:RNA-binding protein [Colletotrichum tofieldiae]|nr:RNA-binding protein [Colletotrichum tofieldiae]